MMDHVSIDAAEALSGEEAFILQLRPPAPPGADEAALAERVDQFTGLYLRAADPVAARFAQLAPLTWAIAASRLDGASIEAVRADLCEVLFGADDPARVQIARQPSEPQTENFAGQPTAAGRAAYDDESETFDIDVAMLDIDDSDVFEVDSWRPSAPLASPSAGEGWLDESELAAPDTAEIREWDGSRDADVAGADDRPVNAEPEADVLSALAELERAFQTDTSGESDASKDAAADAADEAEDWITARAPDPAADAADGAAFDARRFEADLDAFEAAAGGELTGERDLDEFGAADSVWESATPDATRDPIQEPLNAGAGDRFDSMTEAPAPRSVDLAAELAAFRREMRAIAEAIPGAGGGDALAQFREEVEAVAGALGQRVDGAAQRIEAAAERITAAAPSELAGRLDGAAERAERSALLMESSVQDAVRALKAVLDASNTPSIEAING